MSRGGLAVLKQGSTAIPATRPSRSNTRRALAEAGRPEEALAVLRQAERQMVYGQRETIHIMIGVDPLAAGTLFPKPSNHFRRALDIEPDNAAAARDLGYCLYRSGRFAEAVPFYTRAEAGLPEDPVIPAELALCQAALKDYGAAAQSFERALRLQPSQEIYFNYALMTAESGDLAKAVGPDGSQPGANAPEPAAGVAGVGPARKMEKAFASVISIGKFRRSSCTAR